MSLTGQVITFDPKSVPRARTDPLKIDMPDQTATVNELMPSSLLVIIKETEPDTPRVFRRNCEICSVAIPMRTKRIWATMLDRQSAPLFIFGCVIS